MDNGTVNEGTRTMNSGQLRALADFMDAVQVACEEHGVNLYDGEHVEVAVPDGTGSADKAVIWHQRDPRESDPEYWHIEGTFV